MNNAPFSPDSLDSAIADSNLPVQRLPEDLERLITAIEGTAWNFENWSQLQSFLLRNARRFLVLWRASENLIEALEFEEREYGLTYGPQQMDRLRDFRAAVRDLDSTP